MRTIVLLATALTLATAGRTAHAQGGAALGVSATRLTETLRLDESATALTFRRSALRRKNIGLELDAGLFPQPLPGALIATFDIGPGYDLSLPVRRWSFAGVPARSWDSAEAR